MITSLPDVSEVPQLGFDGWRSWFMDSARQIMTWVPESGVAIFFQSDIFHDGRWIDKGYLVQRAAEDVGAHLLWHKIVCRMPPGTITMRRASYSHLICVSRGRHPPPEKPGPHVLADGGEKTWRRGMGIDACRLACRYVYDETDSHTIIDPYCGEGAVLAVANQFGFAAIGVELKKSAASAHANRR